MIGIAAVWIAVLLLLGGYALDRVLRRSIVTNFDAQLEYVLNAMIAASEIGPSGEVRFIRPPADQRFLEPYSGAYFQISGKGRRHVPVALAVGPAAARSTPVTTTTQLHKRDSDEFDGEPLRILERDVDPARIARSAGATRWRNRATTIDEQIRDLRTVLVRSFAVLGFGLLVLAALQAFYGLWPLRRVRREVAAIRSGRPGPDQRSFPERDQSRWSTRSTSCWRIAKPRPRKRGATPATLPMRSRPRSR